MPCGRLQVALAETNVRFYPIYWPSFNSLWFKNWGIDRFTSRGGDAFFARIVLLHIYGSDSERSKVLDDPVVSRLRLIGELDAVAVDALAHLGLGTDGDEGRLVVAAQTYELAGCDQRFAVERLRFGRGDDR